MTTATTTSGDDPRRACFDRLMSMWDALRPLAFDPPPLVAKNGTAVIHPETGKVIPDVPLQLAALNLMRDVMDRIQRIADRPASLEEIGKVVERMRADVREAEGQAEAGHEDGGPEKTP